MCVCVSQRHLLELAERIVPPEQLLRAVEVGIARFPDPAAREHLADVRSIRR